MSGSIAAAITAAATLSLDLSTMSQPVSLGAFVFDGFEVPECVTWGGTQRLSVHKLVGGVRVIDSMGSDDSDITWSGIFLSSDASSRADELNELRKAGALLELIFADRYYLVVISSFSAEMRRLSYVPYKITCTVLTDLSETLPEYTPPIDAVTDDLAYAATFTVIPDTLIAAQDAVLAASALMVPLVALTSGAAATVAVATAVGAASTLINVGAAVAAGQIAGLTEAAITTGVLLGATTAIGATAALQTAAAATTAAASAMVLGAYVDRAATNIALA